MLTVSNTGCGIDHDIQDYIFEPFFSTKGERGTGLGLATVLGIVKQHVGNIWFSSKPGKETTFNIYLPVTEEAPVEDQAGERVVADLKGNKIILLVEDEESVRLIINEILQQLGYTVITAKNSYEALAWLASYQGPVHLLLTDVVLPGMNGKELYGKASQERPGLKVLYLSGYTDDVITHRSVLNKGIHFISKPFSINDLACKF